MNIQPIFPAGNENYLIIPEDAALLFINQQGAERKLQEAQTRLDEADSNLQMAEDKLLHQRQLYLASLESQLHDYRETPPAYDASGDKKRLTNQHRRALTPEELEIKHIKRSFGGFLIIVVGLIFPHIAIAAEKSIAHKREVIRRMYDEEIKRLEKEIAHVRFLIREGKGNDEVNDLKRYKEKCATSVDQARNNLDKLNAEMKAYYIEKQKQFQQQMQLLSSQQPQKQHCHCSKHHHNQR